MVAIVTPHHPWTAATGKTRFAPETYAATLGRPRIALKVPRQWHER
jgi:hypothetical protein